MCRSFSRDGPLEDSATKRSYSFWCITCMARICRGPPTLAYHTRPFTLVQMPQLTASLFSSAIKSPGAELLTRLLQNVHSRAVAALCYSMNAKICMYILFYHYNILDASKFMLCRRNWRFGTIKYGKKAHFPSIYRFHTRSPHHTFESGIRFFPRIFIHHEELI